MSESVSGSVRLRVSGDAKCEVVCKRQCEG